MSSICTNPDPNICKTCQFKDLCFSDIELESLNKIKILNPCPKCKSEMVKKQLFTSTYLGCPICEK